MILCDIGNSFYHFYENGRIWKHPSDETPKLELNGRRLYYISVKESATKRLLDHYPEAIDLEKYLQLDSDYQGLGIDRAVACKAITDGVIVDAGSAITVDIMQNGMHLGGYILPGLQRYKHLYAEISPRLDKAIHFDVATHILPQNTADAISYGIISSIVCLMERSVKNKPIYFTGGDGPYFARHFDRAMVDNSLVFKGMTKIIKESGC